MSRLLPLALAFSLLGCEYVERPHRGLPAHFEAKLLTGETVDRETLKGHPWVVVLWVPG